MNGDLDREGVGWGDESPLDRGDYDLRISGKGVGG